MFIDADSLQERLTRSNVNLDSVKFRRDHSDEKVESTLEIQELPSRGRQVGYKNKTEIEKTIIGLESRILGQTSAARLNNVSQSYAGLCEKGKVNTDASSPINEARKGKVDSEIEKLRSKALEGLMTSASVLNGKISDDMKTSDAIGVASTLVKIVNISTPDEKRDQASRLIIMAPPQRDEKHYDVIDIG